SRKIDRQGLCEYLSRIAVKTPRTILSDIHQLLPGYSATFKNGVFRTEQYWTMAKVSDKSKQPATIDEARKKTLELFQQSIRRRMVADVPVGAFLSGGIDSSAAVAAMATQSPNPISTFSIIF